MSQSRRHSLIESLTNIAVGILLQFFALHFLAALLGFAVTWAQNVWVTAVMTVLSLARSYGLRRLFNRWHLPPVAAPEQFVPLTDLVPGLEVEEAEDPDVAFNEALFASGKCGRFSSSPEMALLRPHPSIHCHFSMPLGRGANACQRKHGYRLAVARRDMRIPLCRSCLVEDPYE